LVSENRGVVQKNVDCNVQNFEELSSMLEWAGVGFGEDGHVLIQKALKRLAVETGARSLKFFGKIYGQNSDYWIISGVKNVAEEGPLSK